MIRTLGAFGALFAATFVFLTGNGLFNTLLSTRMAVENLPTSVIGAVLSAYFVGLLTGAFLCHRLIERVGHIRAFTVFAAGTATAALLHGLALSTVFWAFLRFSAGISTFGMFMVLESWLNECSEPRFRGRVFSIYMILCHLGIGLGQQLLNLGDVEGQDLFIIAGILFALCLVPVSVTTGVHPRLPDTKSLGFRTLFRKAPIGMLGCLAAGMTNSAFFSLAPVVCNAWGFSIHQLSWVMSVTVFSGLAAQWAVGAVSDRFDRIKVLLALAVGVALASGWMATGGERSFFELAVGMGVFGALAFAVYPVSVARAHDLFDSRDAVSVSVGLLFAYSIGACISPLMAAWVMNLFGSPKGLFAFWALTNGLFVAIALYLRQLERVTSVPVDAQVSFVAMKTSSPVVMALDPRADGAVDEHDHRQPVHSTTPGETASFHAL
jgi:MFS family permease